MIKAASKATRLWVCIPIAILLLVMAPAGASVDGGQRPSLYDCTTDFHATTGPSSYPVFRAYGNGSCLYDQLGKVPPQIQTFQVSWNGSGTWVCPSSPLSPYYCDNHLDLAVTITEVHPDGSSVVRNETWHFPSEDPLVVLIYDAKGRLLGDGEFSLLDGSSFSWREYGTAL
jgi:hypothetical protein